jgi:transcriptional regulator with XRE-family HTH domain
MNMKPREELTRFLKSARARITPAELGLPQGERRRAAGLRREEVASLAGMSVTWYTWFEQGRDVQLSAAMLERLTGVLKLSPQEREYLFALAQNRPAPLVGSTDDVVAPSVQHMLDHLSLPALVMTADWMVIGWNRLVARIFRDYGRLARDDRNLFRILLLSDAYRRDEEEYRDLVKRLTARVKWDYSRTPNSEAFETIIQQMLELCPVFRQYWEDSEVVSHSEGIHSVDVEPVGRITFRHTSYAVEQSPSQRLMIFVPLDEESARRLRRVD